MQCRNSNSNSSNITIATLIALALILLLVALTWASAQSLKNSLASLKAVIQGQRQVVTPTVPIAGLAATSASSAFTTATTSPPAATDKVGKPFATVKLYTASWCPSCKFFAPVWKELETIYAAPTKDQRGIEKSVSLVKIDCSNTEDARKIIKEIKLKGGRAFTGYPTITFQRAGEAEEESFAAASETVPQIVEKINLRISSE